MINNTYKYSGVLPLVKLNRFEKGDKNGEYAVLMANRKSQSSSHCFSDLGQELSGEMVGRPWHGLKKGPWHMPDPKKENQPHGYKWKLLTKDGSSVVYLQYFQDEAPFSHQRFDACHWIRFNDMNRAATTESMLACICCNKKKSLPLSRRTQKILIQNPDIVIKPQPIPKKIENPKPQKQSTKNSYTTNLPSTFVGDVHGNLDQILLPLTNKGIIDKTARTVFIDVETTKRVKKNIEGLASKTIVEVPELVLNPKYSENPVVFLGDYIDHCSLKKGMKAFYLMADILNQQKVIQKTSPHYKAVVSILGNHEMQVFNNGKSTWNLKGLSSESKKKFAKALHRLIKKGEMQMSYARGGILATHTCISTTFLEKLLQESDKSNTAARNAVEYFLNEKNWTLYELKDVKKVKKLQITDVKTYQTQMRALSDYINTLSKNILSEHGKYHNGAVLKQKSVLFTDPGANGSITPLWAAPSKVRPVASIQMAYGHCPGECGRTAKFIDGFKYNHIRCYDGRSYREDNPTCYAEISPDGKMSIIKK